MIEMTKSGEENLDCIAEAVMKETSKPLNKLQDLQPLFEEFREKQAESTKHLPNSGNSDIIGSES